LKKASQYKNQNKRRDNFKSQIFTKIFHSISNSYYYYKEKNHSYIGGNFVQDKKKGQESVVNFSNQELTHLNMFNKSNLLKLGNAYGSFLDLVDDWDGKHKWHLLRVPRFIECVLKV